MDQPTVYEQEQHLRKWLAFSTLGIFSIGLGVSLLGEAIIRKQQRRSWFVMGTMGIAALNSGVAFMSDAAKHRLLHELRSQD